MVSRLLRRPRGADATLRRSAGCHWRLVRQRFSGSVTGSATVGNPNREPVHGARQTQDVSPPADEVRSRCECLLRRYDRLAQPPLEQRAVTARVAAADQDDVRAARVGRHQEGELGRFVGEDLLDGPLALVGRDQI